MVTMMLDGAGWNIIPQVIVSFPRFLLDQACNIVRKNEMVQTQTKNIKTRYKNITTR